MAAKTRRYDAIPAAEPRWREGATLFNERRYFESHEVWEALWHDVGGDERQLLQGLIQLAAAYHHLAHGNRSGAEYLYRRGRERLSRWVPARAGLPVAELLEQVDRDFAALNAGGAVGAPQIHMAQ